MQLLRDRDVIFAGYRQPHPLQHHIIVRVQTKFTGNPQVDTDPAQALRQAMDDLNSEFTLLSERLEFELQKQFIAPST